VSDSPRKNEDRKPLKFEKPTYTSIENSIGKIIPSPLLSLSGLMIRNGLYYTSIFYLYINYTKTLLLFYNMEDDPTQIYNIYIYIEVALCIPTNEDENPGEQKNQEI
jgi:hypothetical protein